jgi:hypothetical protein
MYIVSFACNILLSIFATLGWREGHYELFGDNHQVTGKVATYHLTSLLITLMYMMGWDVCHCNTEQQ